MFGFFKRKEKLGQPNPSAIVPKIKHTSFLTTADHLLRTGRYTPEDMPVTEPLVADLLVTYAFDLGTASHLVTPHGMKKFGLTLDQVRQVAISNLEKHVKDFFVEGKPPVLAPITGNNLEACLLLLDDVWDSFTTKLQPELIAAVPTRNGIFVTSSQSAYGLNELRQIISARRKKDHQLTEHLLVRRKNRWEIFSS